MEQLRPGYRPAAWRQQGSPSPAAPRLEESIAIQQQQVAPVAAPYLIHWLSLPTFSSFANSQLGKLALQHRRAAVRGGVVLHDFQVGTLDLLKAVQAVGQQVTRIPVDNDDGHVKHAERPLGAGRSQAIQHRDQHQ
jgi:hypothetical protein